MTPSERLKALLNGEPLDRVPFLSFILGFCAKNVGYPVATIYNDPEKSFRAQVWTREQYGYDSEPFYGYASYGGWEFGGEIKLPDGKYNPRKKDSKGTDSYPKAKRTAEQDAPADADKPRR